MSPDRIILICHPEGVTDKKTIEPGPVGVAVAQNLEQLRESRNLTYAELSRRLTQLGRPIAPLGLTRIRDRQRRVDVDDLVALAGLGRVTCDAASAARRFRWWREQHRSGYRGRGRLLPYPDLELVDCERANRRTPASATEGGSQIPVSSRTRQCRGTVPAVRRESSRR